MVLNWTSEHEFALDGVTYRVWGGPDPGANEVPGRMFIMKPRWLVERYVELIEALRPRTIVELGMLRGGSTAFLAQLARPDRLVAFDLRVQPIDDLERFLDEQNLRDRVTAHYGVDQADGEQLSELVARELSEAPLDLVIDDASHLMHETRASFNRLFPRLRPGGVYLVEDWSWAHNRMVLEGRYQGAVPLSAFVFELILASAYAPDTIAEVTVRKDWALVRRGPAAIDPGSFDVSACLDDLGRDLVTKLESVECQKAVESC